MIHIFADDSLVDIGGWLLLACIYLSYIYIYMYLSVCERVNVYQHIIIHPRCYRQPLLTSTKCAIESIDMYLNQLSTIFSRGCSVMDMYI